MDNKGIRSAIQVAHRWLGITAALLLFPIALSGAVLGFDDPLDRLLNPGLSRVTVDGAARGLASLGASVAHAYPGAKITHWELPRVPEDPAGAIVQMPDGTVQQLLIDPYTARILGTAHERREWLTVVRKLHTQFLAGAAGKAISATGAGLLLLMAVSGVVLWWRRKLWRVAGGSGWAAWRYSLHHVVGIFAALPVLMLAVSGLIIHWDKPVQDWLLDGRPVAAPMTPPSAHAADAVPLSDEALLARASAALPEARPTMLSRGDKPDDPVRLVFKYPEDHTPAGRSQVFLDAYSGQVRQLIDLRKAPLGYRAVRQWNREWHTGSAYGLPTQLLVLLACLALCALLVTGPWIWWQRRPRN